MRMGRDILAGACVVDTAGSTASAEGWRRGIVSGSSRSAAGSYTITLSEAISLADFTVKAVPALQGGVSRAFVGVQVAPDGRSIAITCIQIGSTGGVDRSVYVEIVRGNFP